MSVGRNGERHTRWLCAVRMGREQGWAPPPPRPPGRDNGPSVNFPPLMLPILFNLLHFWRRPPG